MLPTLLERKKYQALCMCLSVDLSTSTHPHTPALCKSQKSAAHSYLNSRNQSCAAKISGGGRHTHTYIWATHFIQGCAPKLITFSDPPPLWSLRDCYLNISGIQNFAQTNNNIFVFFGALIEPFLCQLHHVRGGTSGFNP